MRSPNIFEQELRERFHRVPLDEPESCLECGRPASGGLYLGGEVRALCSQSHYLLVQSAHGQRIDAAMSALNALGHKPPPAKARLFSGEAARQLADWLTLRQAERRNGSAGALS